jgi:hypothetical protein
MPDVPVPWFGLAALIAMFLIPLLPAWLFEGPRTVKHWPRRHVCGICSAPWADGHTCPSEVVEVSAADPPLQGELRRLDPPTELEPHPDTQLARRPA